MSGTSRTRLLPVAFSLVLLSLGAAALAGCARPAATTSQPQPQVQPPGPSATSSPPPTSPPVAATATPAADAAGAATGASLTVGSSKPAPSGGVPRPADSAAAAAAVKLLHETGDIGTVKRISVRGMTQDTKGTWWALVAIEDDLAGSDQAVLSYNGRRWDVMVFGEGVSNDDLPPDVRF